VGFRAIFRYKACMQQQQSASAQVIYGIHAVREIVERRPQDIQSLYLLDAPKPDQTSRKEEKSDALHVVRQAAEKAGIRPVAKSRSELDRLSQNGVHQGVVALCSEFEYETDPLAPVRRAQEAGKTPVVLILDGVTDPQNLGALIRSACVLGADAVVIPQDRAAQVTAGAIKAAAGATSQLPVVKVANLVRAMEQLKEGGLWLVAAVAPGQGGQPLWDLDLSVPIGVVLGGEGSGLRPLVRKTCDLRAEIPMPSGLHGASLNVSAAGAVLLYECMRQQRLQ
jgi:23S rRNA (guanosine2251-2'-O)-methyltransferase